MPVYPHLFTPVEAGPFTLPNRIARADKCIAAETIVVCAGQGPLRALDEAALAAAGIGCTCVGGAKLAELDAKRAIEDGVRICAAL